MYERADWWVRRSNSPEYQAAYNRIAKTFPPGKRLSAVEIGCGNGELLRRIYGTVGKLYGSDISYEMLLHAHENLRSHGIDAHVFSSPLTHKEYEAESRIDRVALVMDNIIATELPKKYFERVMLAFPDIRTRVVTPRLLARLGRVVPSQQYSGKSEESDACSLEACIQAVERLKHGKGIFVLVAYDSGDEIRKKSLAFCQTSGLKYISSSFAEDARLIADTLETTKRGGCLIILGRRRTNSVF